MATNNVINKKCDSFLALNTDSATPGANLFSGNDIKINDSVIFVQRGTTKGIYLTSDASGDTFELESNNYNGAQSYVSCINASASAAYVFTIGSESMSLGGVSGGSVFHIADGSFINTPVMTLTKISSVSYLTMPLLPAFCAYDSSNDTSVTGNGTIATVDFDSERFDQGSDFSNDTFTASVDGKYFFQGNVTLFNISTADTVQLQIVTSNRTYYGGFFDISHAVDTDGEVLVSMSSLCDLDSGDISNIKIMTDGETSDSNSIKGNSTTLETFFSGYLAQ